MTAYDVAAAARYIADAHRTRAPFQNLPGALAPPTLGDAYAVQEALRELWEPPYGPVAGLKIATTTKVMQALMGIDQPCGGMIYRDRIHTSPATARLADFVHLVVECELAVRIGADLPASGRLDRQGVLGFVAEVLPAFELIEDRNAVYKQCKAASLIADNAWNGGIVLGKPIPAAGLGDLDGISGRLSVDGEPHGEGKTDDPLGALAWLANLAAERGRPITAGMVVITGSVMPTFAIPAGSSCRFEFDRIGAVELTAKA